MSSSSQDYLISRVSYVQETCLITFVRKTNTFCVCLFYVIWILDSVVRWKGKRGGKPGKYSGQYYLPQKKGILNNSGCLVCHFVWQPRKNFPLDQTSQFKTRFWNCPDGVMTSGKESQKNTSLLFDIVQITPPPHFFTFKKGPKSS